MPSLSLKRLLLFNKDSLIPCPLQEGHMEDSSGPTTCHAQVELGDSVEPHPHRALLGCLLFLLPKECCRNTAQPSSSVEPSLPMGAGPGGTATAHSAPVLCFPLLSGNHSKYQPTCCTLMLHWVNYCLSSPLEMHSIVKAWSVITIKSVLVHGSA